jgi:isopentenyl-diphosphate delta-isomerase type 1
MSEYFDVVDDKDRVIGCASRKECHGNPGLLHRAVHILVFNSRGDLYLQRRSWDKDIQPGKWDTSVGGHVSAGEGWDDAVLRELAEELCIEGEQPGFLYSYIYRNEMESERIRTYLLEFDGPITPNPEEIIDGRYWLSREIEQVMGNGILTPNFEQEYRRYREWCG